MRIRMLVVVAVAFMGVLFAKPKTVFEYVTHDGNVTFTKTLKSNLDKFKKVSVLREKIFNRTLKANIVVNSFVYINSYSRNNIYLGGGDLSDFVKYWDAKDNKMELLMDFNTTTNGDSFLLFEYGIGGAGLDGKSFNISSPDFSPSWVTITETANDDGTGEYKVQLPKGLSRDVTIDIRDLNGIPITDVKFAKEIRGFVYVRVLKPMPKDVK